MNTAPVKIVPSYSVLKVVHFVIIAVTFYVGISFASSSICFNYYIYASESRLISAEFLPAFKNWVNNRPLKDDEHNSALTAEQKLKTRWQLMTEHMTPHLRKLLMIARPKFFTDQIPPSPLELTYALIKIYKQNGIPERDWILPGVALEHQKTKKIIFKNYISLHEKWPSGYKLSESTISAPMIGQAATSGIFNIRWGTEMNEGYQVLVFYHDLNHVASLTDKDYFYALKGFYKFAQKEIKDASDPIKRADDLYDVTGGYDLIEDFVYIPKKHHEEINRFLSRFRKADGKVLSLDEPSYQNSDVRSYVENSIGTILNVAEWNELSRRGDSVRKKMEQFPSLVQKQNPEQIPREVQEEIKQIKKEYTKLKKKVTPLLEEIKQLLEANSIELGAASGDFFSRRANNYLVSRKNDADRHFTFIRQGFTIEIDRVFRYEIREFMNELIPLITMLIRRSNNQPAEALQEIKDRVFF